MRYTIGMEEITTEQAADHLGCTTDHVAWLVRHGRLPARRIGKRVLVVDADAVRTYAATRSRPGWPRGKRRTPAPTHDEHTARLQALLAAHPELTEIRMDPGYACGQPRIADTRIPADMAATCYREFAYDLAKTQESYDITREQVEQALMWEQIVREAGDG